jgi:2-oxoglutarate ferredoxin oxidoreductase subunit beta
MAVTAKDFASPVKPTWCPGCGDYGIHAALKQALAQVGLAPHEVLLIGGIGCGSKLPDYTNANGFMTLHGRTLPVATGARLANHGLKVITVHGDGDGMGLGMGHFIHTARRNIEIVDLLQNNQIYGLTKGQYSPTSDAGFVTSTSPDGSFEMAATPVALALTAGGTFIARGFAGDVKGLPP